MSGKEPIKLCSIPASSGRDKVDIVVEYTEKDSLLVSRVELSGTFWRPQRGGGCNIGDDYQITLDRVVLSRKKVAELYKLLCTWINTYQAFSVNLSGDVYQFLEISVGQVPDLIFREDKPAVKITYSGGSIGKIELAFIVDQSCLQSTIESINLWLQDRENHY